MQAFTPQMVQAAIHNTLQNEKCTSFHQGISCNQKSLQQFVIASQAVAKMYLMVHLVPFLLFKRKQLKQKMYQFSYEASNAIAGVVAGVALNFQPLNRQSEIALFCLNKSMEILYQMGRRRGWPIRIPFGECLLMAVSLSLISFHYLNNPEDIRSTYLKVIDKVLLDC